MDNPQDRGDDPDRDERPGSDPRGIEGSSQAASHRAAAEEVEMEVEDGLARVRSDVRDDPVAILQTRLGGERPHHAEQA